MTTPRQIASNYIALTKPGIIIGNLITCAAGFFLAAAGIIHVGTLLAVLLGTGFIIGGSCVVNNYLDRNIDKKMARTKNRPSVTGLVSVKNASVYAVILELIGFFILYRYTNMLTALVGAVGVFFYVVVYSLWKRKSVSSTLIGSVSGAIPPVAGYTAVAGRIDLGAVLLFLFLTFWQMPHFYAIGIYRLKDYKAAGIPILPVKGGIPETKVHMMIFIILFLITSVSLTLFGYEGLFFLIVTFLLGFYWIYKSLQGFRTQNNDKWARGMFKYSLVLLTVLCVVMSVDSIK